MGNGFMHDTRRTMATLSRVSTVRRRVSESTLACTYSRKHTRCMQVPKMTVRSSAEAPATTQSQLKTTTKARPGTAAPRHKKAASFTPWQPKPAAPLPALVVTPPAPPCAETPERLRPVVAAVKSGGVVVLDLTVRRARRSPLVSPACNIQYKLPRSLLLCDSRSSARDASR